MKTAVSIPDPLYKQGERIAKQKGVSRSQLYANALKVYFAQVDREELTRQANEYAARFDTALSPSDKRRRYKRLLEVEW
jgi:metal-responsive CopG/Arc/MetJ family transcriptional regulator